MDVASLHNEKKENNQNCQKIKLYGSPTTKELKIDSSRLVGGQRQAARQDGKLGRQG